MMETVNETGVPISNKKTDWHWPQFIITIALVNLVGFSIFMILTHLIPEGNQRIADLVLGYLMAALSVALAFWFNVNAQSVRKDEVIAASMPPANGAKP